MRSRIILAFSFLSVLFAQTQLGSDIDGEARDDWSGVSVSMNSDGDRVAIGAYYNDGGTGDIATIVFTTNTAGQTYLNFTEQTEMVDADDNPITIKSKARGIVVAK